MHKVSLFCLVVVTLFFKFGHTQDIGSVFPAGLNFRDMQSGNNYTISSFKDKIVIIDFWATFCAPCVAGLEKMDRWQREFGDKLVVVAVSHENPERLRVFLKNRPNNLLMVSDSSGELRKTFPYQTIPHLLVVDKRAKIRAITGSEQLTKAVIGKLIKTDKIDLPLKKDNLDFDLETSLTEYFKSDTLSGEGFNMLPAVEGVGTMSKTYPNSSFENRRLTIVNATISLIVQIVYQSSYYRVIDEYNQKISFAQQEKYSIDAWTKEKSEQKLFMYFKEQLAKKFVDLEIVKETRKVNVAVLYADKQRALQLCNNPAASNTGTMNGLTYDADCSTMGDLVEYLEGYGKCGMPVVDETGLAGKYKISFQLEPGKKSALEESLQSLGLYLKKEVREIPVIVIRRKTSVR